mgnify:CR=1 FL=1
MLVTNLLFLHGFIVFHRAFIRNYVIIFQDFINIFEVLERKGFMYQRDFGSSAKTIQKASTNLTEELQKRLCRSSAKAFFIL